MKIKTCLLDFRAHDSPRSNYALKLVHRDEIGSVKLSYDKKLAQVEIAEITIFCDTSNFDVDPDEPSIEIWRRAAVQLLGKRLDVSILWQILATANAVGIERGQIEIRRLFQHALYGELP